MLRATGKRNGPITGGPDEWRLCTVARTLVGWVYIETRKRRLAVVVSRTARCWLVVIWFKRCSPLMGGGDLSRSPTAPKAAVACRSVCNHCMFNYFNHRCWFRDPPPSFGLYLQTQGSWALF